MSRALRTGVVGAVALCFGVAPSLAVAETVGGAPEVVNREVVAAELDSSGKVKIARLLSQLSVFGKGTIDVADPTSSKGLRNLDGFGKPKIKDGKALYTIKVDGSTSRRTVSDFTKGLPVTLKAAYRLNGSPVQAKDIVGESGLVEVTYTVTNVSGTPTDLTFKDGKGVTHTETVNLMTPFVGQLHTTLPGSFADLTTPRADAAGDGRGGTLLTYTMVLFEPIGDPMQTFTWSGQVEDARLPAATLQIVPVAASKKQELNTGVEGYREGAAKASELTAGAGRIDANLLKLQNGAGELLAGLAQLADGASDLKSGLQGKIAPGASDLAAGAQEAQTGSHELASGLVDLADGADEVSGGLAQAKAGSAELADGLAKISGGLDQLAAVDGLPKAKAGAIALRAGVEALRAGLGSASTPGTILYGLAQLAGGATQVSGGLTQVKGGVDQLAVGLPQAKGGVDLVKAGMDAALVPGGPIDQLLAGAGALAPALVPGLTALKNETIAGAAGLGQVSGGLGTAITGVTQLQTGVTQLQGGAAQLSAGIAQVTAGVNQVAVGLKSGNPASPGLAEGLDSLVLGLSNAVSGVSELASGADAASVGGTELDAGLGLLADGGEQLSAGADLAAAGAGELDAGLGKISAGASQLSDGIDEAAAGSGRLAEGLDEAKAGDLKVVDGAGLLRTEGTEKLIEAGNESATTFAEHHALLVAMEEKVADGALPYGAPEGATGTVAYQFELAAATTAGSDNAERGLATALLVGLALAVSWVLRRYFKGQGQGLGLGFRAR